VLIGSVFRAVFSPVPLSLCRCRMLCDQMVTGLGSLPRTAKVHEWESVYAVLRAACYGEPVSIPNLEPAEDLLSRSHRVALRVLQVAELEPGPVNKFLLEDLIAPYDGWVLDRYRTGALSGALGTLGRPTSPQLCGLPSRSNPWVRTGKSSPPCGR
jgi:hypothetical protein